jgi:hypothetical protein
MNVAAEWYDSDVVWAAVSVVATLVGAASAAYVAYMAAFPKRRLTYEVAHAVALFHGSDSTHNDIEVRHSGSVLNDSHLVDLVFRSRGRRDIASSSFNAGEPIRIKANRRVVAILVKHSQPASTTVPAVVVDNGAVLLGPGLITRRQTIRLTLLVDGGLPDIEVQSPLVDVSIRHAQQPRLPRYILYAAAAVLGGTSGAVAIYASTTYSVPPVPAVLALCLPPMLLAVITSRFFS